MAIAVVQDWPEEETDRSTANYDAIHERIMQVGPFDGFVMHSAGYTGHGFRIFEVWESREDFERFVEQTLMPLVSELAGDDTRQPEQTIYELHNFVAAGQ
jgi:hypothetical protein